ncbi:unnamed protein product, partial [Polarella glacialis]
RRGASCRLLALGVVLLVVSSLAKLQLLSFAQGTPLRRWQTSGGSARTSLHAAGEAKPFRASGSERSGYQSKLADTTPIELDGFLDEALNKAGLLARSPEVRSWCDEQGAVELREVIDELDALCEALGIDGNKVSALGDALVQTLKAEQ